MVRTTRSVQSGQSKGGFRTVDDKEMKEGDP